VQLAKHRIALSLMELRLTIQRSLITINEARQALRNADLIVGHPRQSVARTQEHEAPELSFGPQSSSTHLMDTDPLSCDSVRT
jgi:hypothetical protein